LVAGKAKVSCKTCGRARDGQPDRNSGICVACARLKDRPDNWISPEELQRQILHQLHGRG